LGHLHNYPLVNPLERSNDTSQKPKQPDNNTATDSSKKDDSDSYVDDTHIVNSVSMYVKNLNSTLGSKQGSKSPVSWSPGKKPGASTPGNATENVQKAGDSSTQGYNDNIYNVFQTNVGGGTTPLTRTSDGHAVRVTQTPIQEDSIAQRYADDAQQRASTGYYSSDYANTGSQQQSKNSSSGGNMYYATSPSTPYTKVPSYENTGNMYYASSPGTPYKGSAAHENNMYYASSGNAYYPSSSGASDRDRYTANGRQIFVETEIDDRFVSARNMSTVYDSIPGSVEYHPSNMGSAVKKGPAPVSSLHHTPTNFVSSTPSGSVTVPENSSPVSGSPNHMDSVNRTPSTGTLPVTGYPQASAVLNNNASSSSRIYSSQNDASSHVSLKSSVNSNLATMSRSVRIPKESIVVSPVPNAPGIGDNNETQTHDTWSLPQNPNSWSNSETAALRTTVPEKKENLVLSPAPSSSNSVDRKKLVEELITRRPSSSSMQSPYMRVVLTPVNVEADSEPDTHQYTSNSNINQNSRETTMYYVTGNTSVNVNALNPNSTGPSTHPTSSNTYLNIGIGNSHFAGKKSDAQAASDYSNSNNIQESEFAMLSITQPTFRQSMRLPPASSSSSKPDSKVTQTQNSKDASHDNVDANKLDPAPVPATRRSLLAAPHRINPPAPKARTSSALLNSAGVSTFRGV
jgi:hypothetical protein